MQTRLRAPEPFFEDKKAELPENSPAFFSG